MRTHGITHFTPDTCSGCRYKTIGISATPAFQPHFNWSVGKYVNSDREFKDELSRASERASEGLGIDHDFQPRYPGERTEVPYANSDEVLNTRARNINDGVV
jgi:hypothetical protein